jgi:hypothetical protein
MTSGYRKNLFFKFSDMSEPKRRAGFLVCRSKPQKPAQPINRSNP